MISSDAQTEGLRRAAIIIQDEAWRITREMPLNSGGVGSKKIPPTINYYLRLGAAYVSAGGPGGKAAPNAAMFETPGARHPLFGDRKHWYVQPYRPFLEEAADNAGQEAEEAYADGCIEVMTKTSGWS